MPELDSPPQNFVFRAASFPIHVLYDARMRQRTSAAPPFIESDTVELKESFTEDAMSDLAAFANTRGGTLFVGVSNSGATKSCDVSDEMQQRIGAKIRNILQIGAEIRVLSAGRAGSRNRVLAISVERSRSPVLLRGSYWTRMGTTSIKATPEQWAQQVLRQAGISWDGLPAARATLSDIDADSLRQYLLLATGRSDSRLPRGIRAQRFDKKTVLRNLGLLADGRVTNAALLLFGKDPTARFFQARIRVARFPDRERREILEYPEVRGTIFEQIEGAMRLLEEHMPHRMTFPEMPGRSSLYRHEQQVYPSSVAREAIVNAVIHRDYVTPGGDIQIRIHEDEFDIWSPGGLMPGLSAKALYGPHVSVPRNPLIAQVAYFAHTIERWGTGTTKMVVECQARGLPPPEFREFGSGFATVLRRTALTEKSLLALGLNQRQAKAILAVGLGTDMTSAHYRKLTGVPETTAARDIQNLERRGVLERIGTGRRTRYRVRMPLASDSTMPLSQDADSGLPPHDPPSNPPIPPTRSSPPGRS